jgi:hypothetical protein
MAGSVAYLAAVLLSNGHALNAAGAADQTATMIHNQRLRIGSGKRTILNMRPSHAGKPESYYRRPNVPGSVRREQQRRAMEAVQ